MRRFLLFVFLITGTLGIGFAQQSTTTGAQARTGAKQSSSAERIWADLMEGNERFISGKARAVEVVSLRQNLAAKQSPKVIVRLAPTAASRQNFCLTKVLGIFLWCGPPATSQMLLAWVASSTPSRISDQAYFWFWDTRGAEPLRQPVQATKCQPLICRPSWTRLCPLS